MNGNVIRTITIRGTSEGLDKLQTDLTKLAAAHKGVAIAAEETDKKTLSLEAAWKRQTLRLDEAARAQHNIARETKIADQMLREGKVGQAEHARQLELINQHYTRTSAGAQTYGKALQQGTGEARLARHELINLSRQIQDVGVSLASGQAPLTVLVQQGTQIADVFASSSGTLRGFFGQAAAGAGRFLGSFAGITTAAVGMGVAFVTAGSSFASGQREIEKGLSGMGAASGVTRDQINKIAEASSSAFGISASEAREAATAFAATGKIYEANVGQATRLINDYARAGGDASEATKMLGAALMDPAKGALELNKSLNFLNASTLENIRNLQAQGKEQQAQKVLMDALTPAIQKQAEHVGTWAKAWNLATNAGSRFFDMVGKDILTVGEKMTGVNLGGFSQEEQLGRARGRVSGLQEKIGAPRSAMQAAVPQSVLDELKAAQEEVARLEKATDSAAAAFNRLSTEALAAADGFQPLKAQIRDTEQQLAKLREAEAAGAYVNQAAIQAGELRKQQLYEQEAALIRQNEYTAQIAAHYSGMSIEVAKQLTQLSEQLTVAQARTGAEQIVSQEYATQNNLLMQGKTLEEAMAVAAAQREIAEANVSRSIGDQIHALEQQVQLTEASLNNTTEMVTAQQAYTNAIRQGASEQDATRLGQATLNAANAKSQADRINAQRRLDASVDSLNETTKQNTQITLQANQVYDRLTGHILDYTESIIFWARTMADEINQVMSMGFPSQFTDSSGKRNQYVSSYDPLNLQGKKQAYEDAGTPTKMMTHGIPGTLGAFQYAVPDFQAINANLSNLFKSENELTKSTDRLNETMQNALSPFYSQDPRTTKLGFRAGVTGNQDWLTGATNSNPLVAVLGAGATAPGMAEGGSFVVGGGNSANDNRMAVFPVASGEEIVVNRNKGGRGGSQVVHIDNRIIVNGSVDEDTMSRMKVSRFQQAQRMRGQLAQA